MRVRPIPAHNPGAYTGAGSLTYLIAGEVPTLIDAGSGEPRHLEDLESALQEAAPDGASLAQVLVTHAHPDHAGGAPALAGRWPAARFAKVPWAEKDAGYAVAWEPLVPETLVRAGDTSLWVVPTPGHAPDHVCLFEAGSGVLFGGDLVVNGGTVVIPAAHGGSLSHYLDSLRRVLELQPRRILPGHGDPIERPAALIRGYLAHRLARERQIVEALRGGPRTMSELRAAIYPAIDAGLADAAADSLVSHLRKLQDEGRATMEADAARDRWRLVPGAD